MRPASGLVALAALVSLAAAPAPRTVEVAFKAAPGDRWVQVLNLVMGTRTIKRVDASHWVFGAPARGDANDWALFFQALPDAASVAPRPAVPAADRELPPVAMALPSSGMWLSPNQVLGAHVRVTYRGGAGEAELIAGLVDQVYGTKTLERNDGGTARLAPPAGMNPRTAARVLKLCPWISSAEPTWGR